MLVIRLRVNQPDAVWKADTNARLARALLPFHLIQDCRNLC